MRRIVLAVALAVAFFTIGSAAPTAMADTQTCGTSTGLSGCSTPPASCAANNQWSDEDTYDPNSGYTTDTSCGDQTTDGTQPVDSNASDGATDSPTQWDNHCAFSVYKQALWRSFSLYAEGSGAFWCDSSVLQMGLYTYLYEWWLSDNRWHLMATSSVVGGPVGSSAHIYRHNLVTTGDTRAGYSIFGDVAKAKCNTQDVRYWTAHNRGFFEDSVGGWWAYTKPKSAYLDCRD